MPKFIAENLEKIHRTFFWRMNELNYHFKHETGLNQIKVYLLYRPILVTPRAMHMKVQI